ncbi:MAG: OapB/ArvB family protein [Nanoarchaeota archaeon]
MGVQVLSYELLKNYSNSQKIKKILDIVKLGHVVMIEGKLNPILEAELITKALSIYSSKFTGIEVAYLNSVKSKNIIDKFRDSLLKLLAKDRMGITVIGPSKIVKEIKMDPNQLEILFN